MPPLPDQPSKEEVRKAAKHSPQQWDQFVKITADIAKRLRSRDPQSNWRDLSKEMKAQILEDINRQLELSSIPAVDIHITQWRISKALTNLRYEDTTRLASVPSNIATTPSSKRGLPYDPVRDV
ncbi:hypothetical protein J1614_008125 [Plenodomus biglobosus]|nr:hypothetical protein J1614_008125 [Plenodomus biglobosus]